MTAMVASKWLVTNLIRLYSSLSFASGDEKNNNRKMSLSDQHTDNSDFCTLKLPIHQVFG